MHFILRASFARISTIQVNFFVCMKYTRMEPNIADSGLFGHILHTDLFAEVLKFIEDDALFPLWLTCTEFNAHRSVGMITTAVRSITTPCMLEWAIGCGLQPRLVLRVLRNLEPDALTQFGCTIVRMMHDRSNELMQADARNTAVVLLMKLSELEPAALLNPGALATYVGFITEMLTYERRFYRVNNAAEWALETIVCKLGKLEAHVILTGVLADTLGHANARVRAEVLNALNTLDQKVITVHSDTIARFILDVSVQGGDGDAWECSRAFDALCKLDPTTLSEFTCLIVSLLWNSHYIVRSSALLALGQLERTTLTSHAITIARKLDDPDEEIRTVSLYALGMLNQSDLAQYAHAIADMLQDSSCDVRVLAAETLSLLEPVALLYHDVDAVARMLDDEDYVRHRRTLRTLGRMAVADLKKHTDAIERKITMRRRRGECPLEVEALLKRINGTN